MISMICSLFRYQNDSDAGKTDASPQTPAAAFCGFHGGDNTKPLPVPCEKSDLHGLQRDPYLGNDASPRQMQHVAVDTHARRCETHSNRSCRLINLKRLCGEKIPPYFGMHFNPQTQAAAFHLILNIA
jgi:hypothetical protein